MPRIRSIKPEFSRDEKLQDLEVANPGQHCMLVFACLWPHCDKNGNFPWNARTLHLDILPFIQFDLDKTLLLLREAMVLTQYHSEGKLYGSVVNFAKHQRISGKEATEPAKYPEKQSGSNGDEPELQERGMEGERFNGNGKGEIEIPQHPLNYARRIVEVLGMPQTSSNLRVVEASLTAEAQFTGSSLEDSARAMTASAMQARTQGLAIDKFWFEDTKWRNGNGSGQKPSASAARSERSKNNILDGIAKDISRRDAPVLPELQIGAGKRAGR
jgi:hypothetical protein